MTIRW